jgi:peroxiredoxin
MRLTIGQVAPDFTLFDDQKQPFSLSAHRGHNVLLLFFPGAFTGVCTNEMNLVNNDRAAYGDDTRVVGLSTDSPFALAEFRKVNSLTFPLLSDHDAEVCAAYGAKYDRNFTGMGLDRIARRSAFVIDREGHLRYAEVLENAGLLPNLEAVKAVLAGLG